MKFIGFLNNGKGILNEVGAPFGATATIELITDREGIQVFEVNVGETKTRKPYKKKEKEAEVPAD